MATWKIACVQMDCFLKDKQRNLTRIRERLAEAARNGAKVVVFPECALTGYGYDSKEDAWPFAEPVPGPSVEAIAGDCREHQVWAVVGSLERVEAGGELFNVAVLVGPEGVVAAYRKIHLPFLGVDRYTTPGDRPFTVHDIGGLRIGMNICYDGGFPESARCLMLQGADLVVLPTNWPGGAMRVAKFVIQTRAMENHIYYAACNRVGDEAGFHFIGQSRIVDVNGDLMASCEEGETILYADIEPERARDKQIVNVPGLYELHRTRDRRPEMYGEIVRAVAK